MTKSKSLKKALICSVMSLVMCLSMLVGTTFAWFTDSVTNNVNQIVSGNLDVELYHTVDYTNDATVYEVVEGDTALYNELVWVHGADSNAVTMWQPNAMSTEGFKVENKGSLPLKYKFSLNFKNATTTPAGKTLADVLVISVTDANGDVAGLVGETVLKNFVYEGILEPNETYEFVANIAWNQSAGDNDFNVTGGLSIDLGVTLIATQLSDNAEYPLIAEAGSLEEVFDNVNFGYGSTSSAPIVLDGQGLTTITDWTDAWYTNDVTIKGVTFLNGATFSAEGIGLTATITFEDCTFYACDQQKLIDAGVGRLDNSGAGLCLDVETGNNPGVKVVIKNCTFVGEGDENIERNGYKNWTDYNNGTKSKARGYGLSINGVAGNGTAESVLIDGCEFTGIRDNAIQLYSFDYEITIQNCVINGWGFNAADTAGTHTGAAIRGDIDAGSNGSLVLSNNYYGETETATSYHVKVDRFAGNTDGTRVAGTY